MLNRVLAGQWKVAFVIFVTLVISTGLTSFFFLHEQLPRFARAPSALILAPVAIVDGLCYAAGVPGIYGKAFPTFMVNWVFAAVLCGLADRGRSLWRGPNI